MSRAHIAAANIVLAGCQSPPIAAGNNVSPAILELATDTMRGLAHWRGRSFRHDVRIELVAADPSGRHGWYDADQQILTLVGTTPAAFVELTLAHELTHALQDQYYNLAAMARQPRTPAAEHAWRALVEGEATLASGALTGFDTARHPVALHDDGHAPAEQVLFTYMTGARYVSALRDSGGWPAVDLAWLRPPQTPAEVEAIAFPDLADSAADRP